MRFRDAVAGDEPSVQSVVDAVLREYGMALDTSDTDSDLIDLQASYVARGGVFRVLVNDDGAVVGCGGLYPIDRAQIELRKMYLLPAARGRGLGLALLSALVDVARQRGFTRIVLETKSVLTKAIAMYREFGFREIDSEHKTPRCDRAFALDIKAEGS
jgi:putative acetyltransferase